MGTHHAQRVGSLREVDALAVLWAVYSRVQALKVLLAAGAQRFHRLHQDLLHMSGYALVYPGQLALCSPTILFGGQMRWAESGGAHGTA